MCKPINIAQIQIEKKSRAREPFLGADIWPYPCRKKIAASEGG